MQHQTSSNLVYIIVVCYIPAAQLIYLAWYTTCSTEMSYHSILIDSFSTDCALPISYQLHNILLSKQVNELLMHKFKTSRAYLFLFVCITHHTGSGISILHCVCCTLPPYTHYKDWESWWSVCQKHWNSFAKGDVRFYWLHKRGML